MSAERDPDKAFFGHPAGLKTLFFTEMWERLSYYGARAFLAVFMTTPIEKGGLGMSRESMGIVMALYMSSVYLLSLPGGWIADRFIGQRKAVMWGGLGIMIGSTLLALPVDSAFYPGLALVAIGTGLLKPNVSTLVGQLYAPGDIRRDAGFTIYYMGINIGAGLAPLIGMFVAQNDGFRAMIEGWGLDPNLCWKFAFAMPAIGMLFGLIQYRAGWKALGETGLHPNIPSDPKRAQRDRQVLGGLIGGLLGIIVLGFGLDAAGVIQLDKEVISNIFGVGLAIAAIGLFVGYYKMVKPEERKRITAILPLFLGSIGFFGVFEQASTTLSIYAEQMVHRDFLGVNLESSFYQFPNAIFIVILASPFAWMWLKLAKAGKEPSSVTKFGIGMVFTGLSFVVLLPTLGSITERSDILTTLAPAPYVGDLAVETDYQRVSASYLILLYLVSTIAELFISPVGLSSMSKLAPARLAGMVMGTWFLATAIGNYIAGRAAGFSEERGYSFLFTVLIVSSLVIAGALFVVSPMIKRLMEGTPTNLPKATALKPEDGDDKKTG
jgi:POT family proton-dependent oligopeptide transporter